MNYDLRRMAFAFLIACALWVISSSGNTILGTVAMLTVIVASATYHRVAGIIAVLVAIAFMQQTHAQKKEGLTMPAPLQFESAAEFREKFCMKGVAQSAGNEPMVLQYMLSPALFDDTNGKSQFKTDVIQQINIRAPQTEATTCPLPTCATLDATGRQRHQAARQAARQAAHQAARQQPRHQ